MTDTPLPDKSHAVTDASQKATVDEHARRVIHDLANAAASIGFQSGTGGCDIAGAIVSYLANNPEKTEQFFADGLIETLGRDGDMWAQGCLTFHRKDGTITTPQNLRISKAVRDLAKPATLKG